MGGQIWEVVGGSDKGGILVREGHATTSCQLPDRLTTGALVEELVLQGTRLQYSLLSGFGPASGWVTTALADGKDLVVKVDKAEEPKGFAPRNSETSPPDTHRGSVSNKTEERRICEDGHYYTKQEFIDFFGGIAEWNASAAPHGSQESAPKEGGTHERSSQGKEKQDPVAKGFTFTKPDSRTKRDSLTKGFPFNLRAGTNQISVRRLCSKCNRMITGEQASYAGKHFHWECFKCIGCNQRIHDTFFPSDDGNRCENCMMKCLPKCAKCNKPITGQSMAAEGKVFHSECFQCESCCQILKDKYYFEKGSFICHGCVVKRLPKCSKCRTAIEGDGLTVDLPQGQVIYHAECFKCVECHERIWGHFYHEQGNSFKCEECAKKAVPTCPKCHKKIEGEMLTVDQKVGQAFYHIECFRCSTCSRKIIGKFAQEPNGKFRCEGCVHKAIPRCQKCQHPINGKSMTVEGKSWHIGCFQCATCGWRITGNFYQRHGKIVCDWCLEGAAHTCSFCKKPIHGQGITAEKKVFHSACFKCAMCRKQIGGNYFLDKDNKSRILCESCHMGQCPKCAWCSQPILEEHTSAENKSYHKNCFSCSTCGNPIGGEYFSIRDHFICKKCHGGSPPKCVACRRDICNAYLVAEGKSYHHKCFSCSSCKHLITGRYQVKNGCYVCAACHSTDDKGHRRLLQDEVAAEEWFAQRLPQLQRELRELLRIPPKERKKRLRALQLELHPDKQGQERTKHTLPLFLLVQEEWDATEAEEQGKKPVRKVVALADMKADKDNWRHARQAWFAHS